MPRSLLPLLLALAVPARAPTAPADYQRDIKPLLKTHCFSCHGALKQKGKLRLDTASLARKGGRSGPAVVPGQPENSILLGRVRGEDGKLMPPEGKPLTPGEIARLEAWVRQGANGPPDEKPEPDPRQHWAFARPVRPAVPLLPGEQRGNPLDAFLAAERARHGLPHSPSADPATLLRRVYLDLVGLPPTRAELTAFLADPSPEAYEKVVERLLSSPRYGERWARHWMDVWRYADWYGRRAVPDVWNSAPQVWRWRDWIVSSLNQDVGYDRMVALMLAADEIAPEEDSQQPATGYLVRNWYALNPNQWMRDIVEHTGKAFLGLTFNCAHCHDHKYDPISQEEYFRFRAFFEPLGLRQDRVPGEPDPGPFQKYSYSVLRKVVRSGRVAVFDEQPGAKTWMYSGGDERERIKGRPPVRPGAPAFLDGDRLAIEPVTLPATAWYPGLKPFVQQEEIDRRARAVSAARAAVEAAKRALDAAQARQKEAGPQRPEMGHVPLPVQEARTRVSQVVERAEAGMKVAQAVLAVAETDAAALAARIAADRARYDLDPGMLDELAKAASAGERKHALALAQERVARAELDLLTARHNALAPAALKPIEQRLVTARQGVEAASKAISAVSTSYTPLSPVYPSTSTGRRRALASWLTSRDNPLTARVAVNHVWRWHFGKPLVETVADFGRNGQLPTHPELLDWLAVELMESGWSLKHLHRLIVTSAAYRQRSAVGDNREALARDPDNRFLWRFPRRRVEAEVVRDTLLHAAGELDGTLGGPPLDATGPDSPLKRRSLYFSIYPEVGGQVVFLSLFDAPNPCDCYARSCSVLPQQALALTNSQLLAELALALARKLPPGLDGEFLRGAFEQVLSRPPTAQELALCQDFLARQLSLARATGSPDPALRARASLVRVLFSHDDFLTLR